MPAILPDGLMACPLLNIVILAAGFFRYLTKPIKVNEFMDALDVALKYADKEGGQSK
jgi:CheY-like chemotaxis protein